MIVYSPVYSPANNPDAWPCVAKSKAGSKENFMLPFEDVAETSTAPSEVVKSVEGWIVKSSLIVRSQTNARQEK